MVIAGIGIAGALTIARLLASALWRQALRPRDVYCHRADPGCRRAGRMLYSRAFGDEGRPVGGLEV